MGSGETWQKTSILHSCAAEGWLCWQGAAAIRPQAASRGNTYPRCVPRRPVPRQRVFAMRSRPFGDGKMLAKCVPQRPAVARCARIASPNVRRRQDFAVVCSWAAVRGNILARCILRRLAVARNCSDAFSDALPRQFSRFMHPKRGLGREKRPSLATYRRHASKTSWLWQDMRTMYPKSPANRLSGMHSAQILPGRGPFRCTDPSNHAWGTNLAIARV